ncbi:MAG: 6-hydroxymethylpterin diphosphokinase MptE-like protein [Nitrososphaeria archaeon]
MERLKLELYEYVINELKIDPEKDWEATLLLDKLLRENRVEQAVMEAKNLIKGKSAVVVGAGPSVLDDLEYLKNKGALRGSAVLSADGASLAYKEFSGINPDIIVTDLDGFPELEVEMANMGSVPFVHAHGDNMDRLLKYVPRMNLVAGTTQTRETDRVKNYGGFTDGDRAAFIACSFGAISIYLAGMDFGNTIGRYSNLEKFGNNLERKKKKLKIGIKMLEALASVCKVPIVNVSKDAVNIKGIITIKR